MRKLALAVGAAAVLFASSASAMTVQEFLASAARVPRSPVAMFRPDARRLFAEVKTGFRTIRAEQATARSAGRVPSTCMPANVALSPEQIVERLNTIPVSRRSISVTSALREWMAERYPCAA